MHKFITYLITLIVLSLSSETKEIQEIRRYSSIDVKLTFKDQSGRIIPSGYVNVDNAGNDGSKIIDGIAEFKITDYLLSIWDIQGTEAVTIEYYTIAGQWLYSTRGTVTKDHNKLRVVPNKLKYLSNQLILARVYGSHFEKVEKILSGQKVFYLHHEANMGNGNQKSAKDEGCLCYTLVNNFCVQNKFSFIDTNLSIPIGSQEFEDTIIVNSMPFILDKDYTHDTINRDTIIPLQNLIRDDDAKYSIRIIEGEGNAKIESGSLYVSGDVILNLIGDDTKHEPVYKYLSFIYVK